MFSSSQKNDPKIIGKATTYFGQTDQKMQFDMGLDLYKILEFTAETLVISRREKIHDFDLGDYLMYCHEGRDVLEKPDSQIILAGNIIVYGTLKRVISQSVGRAECEVFLRFDLDAK